MLENSFKTVSPPNRPATLRLTRSSRLGRGTHGKNQRARISPLYVRRL
jgi:hypothetical protein